MNSSQLDHPFDLRIDALRSSYRAGHLTPRALMAALRARAAALDPEYAIFIRLLEEAELEPYLVALERRAVTDLPLYGIPFAIKDNIDLAGVPTTAACPAFAYQPARSSTLVERLIALGAIPLGKTNLDQFATGLNGTRSPYGVCRNAVLPEYPAGGSSSGSALAVALGLASFALGTDTAGSGRVPAALNNLIGIKPTRGLLSTAGVVPACRTLDCLTFFTATAVESSRLLALSIGQDERDPFSRANPSWNHAHAFGAPGRFRFGVPCLQDRDFLGCTEGPALFAEAVAQMQMIGGEPVEIDLSPFLQAARLLYEGPWIAERYHVAGALIERQPQAVLPVIRDILAGAPAMTAVQTFDALYRLQGYKARCDAIVDAVDCVLTPTIARAVTLQELEAEPILRNSELGYYTNFMNLLDYAAVAVPVAFMSQGLPWGITLFGRAFTDQYLLSVADALQRARCLPLVGNHALSAPGPATQAQSDRLRLLVCGAHLQGLPLNDQLTARGATLLARTTSSPDYKLYALPGATPMRPGLVRVGECGCAIEVEVWELPAAELGTLVAGIPAPLGLGKVELADGRWETGFICEPHAIVGATDISHFGGWRAYLGSL